LRFLYIHKSVHALLTGCLMLLFINASSQVEDSAAKEKPIKKLWNSIYDQVVDAVTIDKVDTLVKVPVLNTESEKPYQRHEGKIIRNITIDQLKFERTFTDTSRRINYFGTRVLNALHKDTHEWVIRENLFIKENAALNGLMVAENERYLRSLDFIQDARIVVKPIRGKKDSVDITVITKDFFTKTGGIDVKGIDRVRFKIAENNLMGMGQRIQFTTLIEKDRQPVFGYEVAYTKHSFANTFINATIGYTQINTGRSDGNEDEKAFFFRMDRPLVSQYSRIAGGFELSYNHSENFYRRPDSLFYNYRYNIIDGWIGYNLGVTKLLKNNDQIRDRSFLAIRYLRNKFVDRPYQIGERFDPLYNSRQALLGEFTLFRQNFYKTNYVYGFGTTEDLPYGINIAFTGGWYKQLNRGRTYFGVNANHFIVTRKGEFMHYFLRSGSFWHKGTAEDASLLLGGNLYSRLFYYKDLKLREYIKFSYTRQINRLTFDPLRIDNPYGIKSFRSDSALGNQRLSFYAETFMFTNYLMFGFKFAPFIFTDLSLLTPEKKPLFKSELYSGIGGGIRTRNENLIFGTVELRLIYFPNKAERMNSFKISFRSNIRFRYNTRYIKVPDIIRLNTGDGNEF